ncbi:MAG: cyclic nucleotide-binding domain-containing protein [Deltaproteobacteria bacterium]|nr:cyclic nucleotide-binding domain-containing protein [Deltaproteobacteria bacterium]
MPVTPADLGKIPLFANMTEAHLREMLDAFDRERLPKGSVIFEPGSTPERLLVLAEGEVALHQDGEERFRVRGPAPIGELGSLTGLLRSTTAIAATDATMLVMPKERMLAFFEDHGDVAFPFHSNLLSIAADKMRRDRQRIEEMRHNLIITQRAMKRMSDLLLEGEDTPLHEKLYDELSRLIEQNKKGHYLVEPAKVLPTKARFDDGRIVDVLALSADEVDLPVKPPLDPKDGHASFVLDFGDKEIAVSGKVEPGGPHPVRIKLDLLVEGSAASLSEHLARMLMFDVIC